MRERRDIVLNAAPFSLLLLFLQFSISPSSCCAKTSFPPKLTRFIPLSFLLARTLKAMEEFSPLAFALTHKGTLVSLSLSLSGLSLSFSFFSLSPAAGRIRREREASEGRRAHTRGLIQRGYLGRRVCPAERQARGREREPINLSKEREREKELGGLQHATPIRSRERKNHRRENLGAQEERRRRDHFPASHRCLFFFGSVFLRLSDLCIIADTRPRRPRCLPCATPRADSATTGLKQTRQRPGVLQQQQQQPSSVAAAAAAAE